MPHRIAHITPAQLADALALRDLTDPAAGRHCLQALAERAADALVDAWGSDRLTWPGERIVAVADNYDALGYPADGPARDARYTRYVTDTTLLRTQTSAAIPGALRALAAAPPDDVLIAVPGLTYRRDAIDRLHVGEPHQLDLWRICRARMTGEDLREMIATVVDGLLPGARWRALSAVHPYTLDGLEVEVLQDGAWVELLECGLAHPRVLAAAGLPDHAGLAMGLGLDRASMLRKHVPDIRLLRSGDPRVASQMLDLQPYRPVSAQPATRRDLSVARPPGADAEALGDLVRSALGADEVGWIEEVALLSRTPACELPDSARRRMGIASDQENLLVRVVLRHPTRALTKPEANRLRDRVYAALHAGACHEWSAA
jgi:phenylalanyl-tRNA synthetase alpha chain